MLKIKERLKELYTENTFLGALILIDLAILFEVTIVDNQVVVPLLGRGAGFLIGLLAARGMFSGIKKYTIKPSIKIMMYILLLLLLILMIPRATSLWQ